MPKLCQNYSLQTSPQHIEAETKNTNSRMTSKGDISKTTSSLFPSEMMAKLETTLSTTKQNNDHTIKPTKQWEHQ